MPQPAVSNEILDDVRTICPTQSGSVEVITTEVVVLDVVLDDDTPVNLRVPTFSSPGDSGAPIFDLRGRMVGMLIGVHRDGHPGSWLTPVEWILDDIQKTVSTHLGTVDVHFL